MGARLTASVSELEARIRDADRTVAAGDQAGPAAVAWALIEKGEAHRDLLEHQSAAQAFEQAAAVAARYQPRDKQLRELHVLGLALQAGELVRLKRPDDGLAVSRRALEMVGNGDGLVLRRAQAAALTAEALALLRSDRPSEALEACDRIVNEFAANPVQGPKRANVVVGARMARAIALMSLDQPSEAEAELVKLLDDNAADGEPAVQLVLGRARAQRAKALIALDRSAEAAQVRRDLLDEYGGSDEPRFRELAVAVGLQLGVSMLKDQDAVAALNVTERLHAIWRSGEAPGPPRLEVAVALLGAQAQLRLNRTGEALESLDLLIARADSSPALTNRTRLIARLLSEAVDQLIEAGRTERALETVNNALARLRPIASDPDELVRLWRRKLKLLRGEPQKTLTACEEITAVFCRRDTAQSRWMILHSASAKATALISVGRTREGLQVSREAITAFEDDSEPTMRAQVAALMAFRAELELIRHRPRTALRTYRELRDYCGENPPELLQRQADLARTRSAVISSDRADRQRLLTATAVVLVIWTAPAAIAVLRVTHRPQRRTRQRRID